MVSHQKRMLASAAIVTAAIVATGCASHHPQRVSDRFVKQGKPTVDLGGPPPSGTAAYVAKLRKVAEEAKPRAAKPVQNVAEVQDPALRDRLAALKAAPTSAEAYRAVAIEYRRLKILDTAYSHLSTAIKLAPNDPVAYDLRARIWREWGLPALGLADAAKAVSLAPKSATAWNTMGLLLEDSGRRIYSQRAFQKAVALDANAAWAWNNLCHVRAVSGDAAAAVQACQRTLELAPATLSAQVDLNRAERQLAPPVQAQPEHVAAEGPGTLKPGDQP